MTGASSPGEELAQGGRHVAVGADGPEPAAPETNTKVIRGFNRANVSAAAAVMP